MSYPPCVRNTSRHVTSRVSRRRATRRTAERRGGISTYGTPTSCSTRRGVVNAIDAMHSPRVNMFVDFSSFFVVLRCGRDSSECGVCNCLRFGQVFSIQKLKITSRLLSVRIRQGSRQITISSFRAFS